MNMPKKTKRKASKKSTKKAAVKKTAKKKTTKKAPTRAAKKKSTGRSARAMSGKTPVGTTLRTPDICTGNFSGKNSDPVEFQNIPQNTTVTLYQVNSSDYYPFSPYETDDNGLRYTEIESSDQVTIVVPALNQTYYYLVEGDANCPNDDPGHSVTVNS
jgi:hypothetical protein